MSTLRRITNLFRRRKIQREIDAELAAHLALRTEDNVAAGMTKRQALRDARLRFGNAGKMRENAAEADTALSLERFASDIRFSLRQLRNTPGFAVPVVLILALGIGACTAIFSAIKPILIDPLPYPQPRQLMMLRESTNGGPRSVNFATFHGVSEHSQSISSAAAMKPWQPAIAAAQDQAAHPERLEGQRVTAGFFQTLGISPLLGRDFQPADDRFRGPNVAILSNRLWQRRFGADPKIVGSQIPLDGNLFTVIGVMPASFENVLQPSAEIWAPLQYNPSLPVDGREWGHHLRVVARLRKDVTPQQAHEEMAGTVRMLAQSFPDGYRGTGGAPIGMAVNPLQQDLTSEVRPALFAVVGAVALVLLIACVNVTNLLLARGAQRHAEFAMRTALGASRTRLIRQLLTESLLLALFGGALGIGIAAAGIHALVAMSPPELPRVSAITLDATTFLFAFGITALIGTTVGLLPALAASRADLQTGMRQLSRQTAGVHRLTRSVLVIAEVSLAVVLLVGAGLLLRTMQHLLSADPGFESAHLLTMQVQETGHGYDTDAARLLFFQQALDRIRSIPGVVSAGFTTQLPLSGEQDVYGAEFEGVSGANQLPAFRYAVTPGYFESMHIPLRRGRLLNEHDIAGAPGAVLISESLARQVFPGQNPLGRRIRVGLDAGHADKPWANIVGVVGDVKQESLAIADDGAFYLPTSQWNWVDTMQSLVVRTDGDPTALASVIREAIWSVDRNQPIVRVMAMQSLVAASELQRRFVLMLFEAFALAGIVLAATGIYGLLAGSVTERTREIGVRTALGASRGSIITLVTRQGMTLTLVGAAIGMAAAAASSRTIAALLSGVSPLDPVTYVAVALLLLCVAAIACLLPARRAASIDPVEALRAE